MKYCEYKDSVCTKCARPTSYPQHLRNCCVGDDCSKVSAVFEVIPESILSMGGVPPAWQEVAPQGGPGTELKKLLAGWPFYITSSPDCSCNRVAAEMDQWGADVCEEPEKQDYILAAMRENAEKRGLPFLDAAGRLLIRRAIKNARKNKIDQ